ncbi:MAG: hypothetical protein U1E27_14535 [Kiritimatiellia bacterium]|nr:hypothetical protein [Kiritimatiellia bacterium]
MKTLVYYITSHGHGHAARSCELLCALHARAPDLRLRVVTRVDPAFLELRLAGIPVEISRRSHDTGLVQRDSVRSDPEATLEPALNLVRNRAALVREETDFLRNCGASVVVTDIPSIPLEAAAEVAIPGFGVGNFSWNWIYEAYAREDPRWVPVVRMYEEGYRRAEGAIRLPFHEPMNAFRSVWDTPLFAKPGRNRRAEMAARAGCPLEARWVLVGLSSLHWSPEALRRISALRDHVFWTVRPLEWVAPHFFAADPHEFPFCDVLASCDLLLTKPGFGVVSESIVNAKPIVHARREAFAEAPLLEDGIRRFLKHAPLDLPDLYAGRIGKALQAAMDAPHPPETLEAGGEIIAADRILQTIPF